MDEKEKAKENDREEHDGAAEITDIGGFRLRCITVVGQVEGHYLLPENQKVTKYEHMIPALTEAEDSREVDGLLILLNTVGGDVEAGLAIAEMIASMSKPAVSLVLGGGHSIGVPLAVSAKKSFIVPSATMTIHPVRISGTVVGVPQTYYYFERMQKRIMNFVVSHSNITEEKFNSLLMRTDMIATDIGSVIDGREAVECGLIDEVGGLCDAVTALREMIKERKSGE